MRHQRYVLPGTTAGVHHAAPGTDGLALCGAEVDPRPVDLTWLETHGWTACPRCAEAAPAVDPEQAGIIAANTLIGMP